MIGKTDTQRQREKMKKNVAYTGVPAKIFPGYPAKSVSGLTLLNIGCIRAGV